MKANSGECFLTASKAAEFISAAHSKQVLDINGFTIESLRAGGIQAGDSGSGSSLTLTITGLATVVLMGTLIGVMVSGQRKRARGITWFPEGFFPMRSGTGAPRRRPDGQEMRSISKLSAQRLDANDNHGMSEWSDDDLGNPPTKRMRPHSSTPESSYGDTHTVMSTAEYDDNDPRPWTQQHLNAADVRNPDIVAMTPPQHNYEYESHIDVDVRGPGGLTPLMCAAIRGNGLDQAREDMEDGSANVIQDLLNQGAKLTNRTEKTGETSLHLAARYARSDAAKRLLDAGANPNAQDATGRTPLHAAVAADAVGVFQILLRNRATDLNAKMYDGTTPLILAVRMGVEGMVEDLINAEVDVNLADEQGKTALHWAAAINQYQAVRILLNHAANRDAQDHKEETPLFLAAREGARDAAKILLEFGANRDITDHMDRLPRDVAAERKHTDMVQLLEEFVPPTHNLQPMPIAQPVLINNARTASSAASAQGGTGKPLKKAVRRNQNALPKEPASPSAENATSNKRRTQSMKKKREPPSPVVLGGMEGAPILSPSSIGSPRSATLSPSSSLYHGHSLAVSQPNLAGHNDTKQPPRYEDCVKGASGIYDMTASMYGGANGLLDSTNIYTAPMQPPLQPQPAVHSRQQSLPAAGFSAPPPVPSPTKHRPALPTSPTHMLAMRQQHAQNKPKISSGSTYEFPMKSEPTSIYSGSSSQYQVPPTTTTPPAYHFPTPPSVSQVSQYSDHPTPQHFSTHDPSYLTPSPESPGQWSSSSPQSAQSDWSDAIHSPSHAPLEMKVFSNMPAIIQQGQQQQQQQQAPQQQPQQQQQTQKTHPDPVFI